MRFFVWLVTLATIYVCRARVLHDGPLSDMIDALKRMRDAGAYEHDSNIGEFIHLFNDLLRLFFLLFYFLYYFEYFFICFLFVFFNYTLCTLFFLLRYICVCS